MPSLAHGEAHVWYADLDRPPASIRHLAQTLTADERLRAARLSPERHRRRYVVARGLLRLTLSWYLDTRPDRLRFHYGAFGKPALASAGTDALGFNLSHSDGLMLIAVAPGHEIGVDVEHVRPLPELGQIARRFFSARENTLLRSIPPQAWLEAFFCCWTRREAYLKAVGGSWAQSRDGFDVALTPGEPARLLNIAADPHGVTQWTLCGLDPAPGCVGALAINAPNAVVRCWQWSSRLSAAGAPSPTSVTPGLPYDRRAGGKTSNRSKPLSALCNNVCPL